MFYSLLTVTLLILNTFDVSGNPLIMDRSPITLPITRRLNLTSPHNLLRHDQARARALRARGTTKSLGMSLENDDVFNQAINNQVTTYLASVGVGDPPTTCMFIIFLTQIYLSIIYCSFRFTHCRNWRVRSLSQSNNIDVYLTSRLCNRSNTWIGAQKAYVRTGTSTQTSDKVVCNPN